VYSTGRKVERPDGRRSGGGRSRAGRSGQQQQGDSTAETSPALDSQIMSASALGSSVSVAIPPVTSQEQSVINVTEHVSVLKLCDKYSVICITETKGHIKMINEIAKRHNACAVIHAGDFGFHDTESYKRLSIK